MKRNDTVSLLLDLGRLDELISLYAHETITIPNDYVHFAARHDGVSIFVYKKEHKGAVKVVFQGNNAEREAAIWGYIPPIIEQEDEQPLEFKLFDAHIGSDEVGTGDLFGPIIVVAAYFGAKQRTLLNKYRIGDSKKLTDEYIRQIGPTLIKSVPYSLLTVTNEKYNQLISEGHNINSVKAWLHQTALANMKKRIKSRVPLVIDQFCAPATYQKYVKDHEQKLRDVVFETKAESRYPAVAIASIIARYAFLSYMDKLDQRYNVHFPLGAGSIVDKFTTHFLKTHNIDELGNLVKQNFRNYKDLIKKD